MIKHIPSPTEYLWDPCLAAYLQFNKLNKSVCMYMYVIHTHTITFAFLQSFIAFVSLFISFPLMFVVIFIVNIFFPLLLMNIDFSHLQMICFWGDGSCVGGVSCILCTHTDMFVKFHLRKLCDYQRNKISVMWQRIQFNFDKYLITDASLSWKFPCSLLFLGGFY